MSVLINKDRTELVVNCRCGCDATLHIRIDKEDPDEYAYVSYLKGSFYSEQGETTRRVIGKKLKKIWAIIRNKDFYYSDILMTPSDWEEFRTFINEH